MALIPITFQADLGDENAKGNMRPEDMAALFAFLYPQEAGILNITGQDCSQHGSINTVGSTAQMTFRKGYIVVQGRAIYIEEGTQVAFNLPASGEIKGVLGVKINLAESGATEVTWFQKANDTLSNDLLANTSSGIYEFVLYYYTATNSTLTLDKKTDQIIENANDYWKNADFITQEVKDNSRKIATTEFVKASCGLIDIEGTLKIQAFDRGNLNRNAVGKYNFVGNGTFALNKNGRIVWQGNLVSKQKPTEVTSANGGADVGYVGRVNLMDFTITKVNGESVTTNYRKILDLGVLFHNTTAVNDNGGRSILQGGAPNSLIYYSLEDGKAFRLDRENHLRINGMVIEFKV